MKALVLPTALFALLITGQTTAQDTSHPPVDKDKLAETFGHFIGKTISSDDVDLDTDRVIEGIRKAKNGEPAPLSDLEYEIGLAQMQEAYLTRVAGENLQKAEKFLKHNRLEEGVVSSEDHKLQYIVLEEGEGHFVEPDGSPEVNYRGSLLDGEEFASSDQSGPITLNLSHTIPGFRKGIAGMREGEKRRLFVHPELGYGMTGQLPPNSLLIFEVEVLKADAGDDELLDDEEEEDYEALLNYDFDNEEEYP